MHLLGGYHRSDEMLLRAEEWEICSTDNTSNFYRCLHYLKPFKLLCFITICLHIDLESDKIEL